MIPVWVVRRLDNPANPVILSAWTDIYHAKHEAQRWEEDSKIEHDYIEGVLILAPHRTLST